MAPRSFKVRYVGAMRLSGPGGVEVCTAAVEKVKAGATQISRALLSVADGLEPSLRISDRSGKNVLLVATRRELSCHGLLPNNANFLALVVQAAAHTFYIHVLNLQSSVAMESKAALANAFGGGACAVLPAFGEDSSKAKAAAAKQASKRLPSKNRASRRTSGACV